MIGGVREPADFQEVGMACRICGDERLGAIDAELRAGQSARAVAREYGQPEALVRRHRAHGDAVEAPAPPPAAPLRWQALSARTFSRTVQSIVTFARTIATSSRALIRHARLGQHSELAGR